MTNASQHVCTLLILGRIFSKSKRDAVEFAILMQYDARSAIIVDCAIPKDRFQHLMVESSAAQQLSGFESRVACIDWAS
jgi:hypothetical protein